MSGSFMLWVWMGWIWKATLTIITISSLTHGVLRFPGSPGRAEIKPSGGESMKRYFRILRHSFTMVGRTLSSYALLSVTIVLSFSLLLGYLLFVDCQIYNDYKTIFQLNRGNLKVSEDEPNSERFDMLVQKASQREDTCLYVAYHSYPNMSDGQFVTEGGEIGNLCPEFEMPLYFEDGPYHFCCRFIALTIVYPPTGRVISNIYSLNKNYNSVTILLSLRDKSRKGGTARCSSSTATPAATLIAAPSGSSCASCVALAANIVRRLRFSEPLLPYIGGLL